MKTIPNSRPLALWSVISVTMPSLVAQVVLLGEERELLEELLDRPPSSAVASYSRATPTSSSRFSSRPCASIVRSRLERLGVAGLLERLREQVAHAGAALGALAQPLHHRHEAAHGLDRGGGQAGHRLRARRPRPRSARRSCSRSPPAAPARSCADAAPRRVHDAPERDRVGRVHEQRQVGERVLDLGALVEARAADHLVADPVAHQHVLEHPALRVRPVEDRDLVARLALVHEPLDLGHDEARLGVLVLELAHVHRIALAELRPERLVLALAVVGDHRRSTR